MEILNSESSEPPKRSSDPKQPMDYDPWQPRYYIDGIELTRDEFFDELVANKRFRLEIKAES